MSGRCPMNLTIHVWLVLITQSVACLTVSATTPAVVTAAPPAPPRPLPALLFNWTTGTVSHAEAGAATDSRGHTSDEVFSNAVVGAWRFVDATGQCSSGSLRTANLVWLREDSWSNVVGMANGTFEYQVESGDVSIAEHGRLEKGAKEGRWVRQERHGGISVMTYSRGVLDGPSYDWLTDGEGRPVETLMVTYCAGAIEGTNMAWFPNGEVKHRYVAQSGQYVGAQRSWHVSGLLASEISYAHGHPVGRASSWYDNGRVASEILYSSEGEIEVARHWDAKGNVVASGVCRAGRPWDGTFLSAEMRSIRYEGGRATETEVPLLIDTVRAPEKVHDSILQVQQEGVGSRGCIQLRADGSVEQAGSVCTNSPSPATNH